MAPQIGQLVKNYKTNIGFCTDTCDVVKNPAVSTHSMHRMAAWSYLVLTVALKTITIESNVIQF